MDGCLAAIVFVGFVFHTPAQLSTHRYKLLVRGYNTAGHGYPTRKDQQLLEFSQRQYWRALERALPSAAVWMTMG